MRVGPWFSRLFSSPAASRRDAVLVFAQDPVVASLLEAALLPAGFEVIVANSVEDGIVSHWQHHESVALVVVADPPPGLSVRRLLACLRAADPTTAYCVLASGTDSPEVVATTPRPSTIAEARKVILPFTRPASRQMAAAC